MGDWKARLEVEAVSGSVCRGENASKLTQAPRRATMARASHSFLRLLLSLLGGLLIVPGTAGLSGCGGSDTLNNYNDDPVGYQDNVTSQAGDYYRDFLTSKTYTKLLIEVDVVAGAEPDPGALETLVNTIKLFCDKTEVDVVFPDDTIPADPSKGADPEYTFEDIDAMEKENRDNYRHDDTAVLYFLYVDGHSEYDDPEQGTAVLGYAYRGSSMTIFMGTIRSNGTAKTQAGVQKIVTVHEFGHQIGLVDNGADMVNDHLDPVTDHGPHCDNDSCMMYWLNNGSDVFKYLFQGDIPDFDSNCLDDIAAAGGKDAHGVVQPN